jgi:glutaminyl-tRNA synthetase
LVKEKIVDAWDDPRMPTISGMRRRGYTPESLRNFSEIIGVTKKDSTIEMGVLENCLREDLNTRAERRMAVIDPLKVTIENYPEDKVEIFNGLNHPQNPEFGTREIPFSREIYIERDDFMEDAPRKFFRLAPGREVRLRFAYYITCKEVVKDQDGNILELICTYDPESHGGNTADGRKVKGTIHWVSAQHAQTASVRVYDRLFNVLNPSKLEDIHSGLNPDSLIIYDNAKLEPSIPALRQPLAFQFERLGYFIADTHSTTEQIIFNRTMSLRDSWAKVEKEQRQ